MAAILVKRSIILVQGFCPLKVKSAQFPGGFSCNLYRFNRHLQFNIIIYTSLFHYHIPTKSKAITLEEKHNDSLHYDAGIALKML